MATYPSYQQHISSRAQLRDGVEIDRAGNGSARARSFWAAQKYEFDITHPSLTLAERDSLVAFHAANNFVAVDFVSEETRATHSCLFDGPPLFEPLGANMFRARVKLVEV